MIVRPFILLGASQLVELQLSLLADIRSWAVEWIGESIDSESIGIQLRVAHFEGIDATENTSDVVLKVEDSGTQEWAICTYRPATADELVSTFLHIKDVQTPTPPGTGLIQRVVRESLLDLMVRFLPHLDLETAAVTQESIADYLIPEDSYGPGSGLLQLHVDAEGIGVMVCLPQSSLLSRLSTEITTESKESVPSPPNAALSNQKVTARVVLGDAELTLGALNQLKIGDVIKLDKPLQEPLSMLFDKSPVGFSGYLGREQDQLAFKVADLAR
ncbi:MAG: FliM/FliN family flagellar motor switch protein [Pseudomonadales bacterium]